MGRSRVEILAGVTLIGLMTLSAAPFAGLLYWAALPSYGVLLLSPVLYFGWLAMFLRLSAALVSLLGARHPKPRRLTLRPGVKLESENEGAMVTAGTCYRIYALLTSVPFLSLFAQLPYFKTLIYRAYAPSVHMSSTSVVMGRVLDPDLTEICDFAVIGGNAAVVAHSMAYYPSGERVFLTAPVTIRERATIGGEALISLGCVIEEDAIVEPGSVVEPFTRIRAKEVWGGNPARFRRHRDDPSGASAAAADVDLWSPAASTASAVPAQQSVLSHRAARDLVIDALGLPPDVVESDPNLESVSQWDSLGQVSIAAALFDRCGISVESDQVFRLNNLQDIIDAAGKGPAAASGIATTPATAVPARTSHEDLILAAARDDVEMLALLEVPDATRILAAGGLGAKSVPTPLRVNIAANFTAQGIEPTLKLWGRAFGFDISCQVAGYDQIVQSVIDPHGPFQATPGAINVVLVRPDDLSSVTDDAAEAQVDQLLQALQQASARRSAGSRWLVGTLPPVVSAFSALDRDRVESIRFRWRARLAETQGIELFDFARLVEGIGLDRARSSQAEVGIRAGYSPRIHQEIAVALVRQIRAARGAPAKVIAVDCDNTLWGGVLGEAGLHGLELGSEGVGRSYQLFQQYLKRLQQRGFLLVVVSKNEPRDVQEVFAQHPGMVLRKDDIAAWRVNWNHKSESLRELADELNLGLDAFVLLDDDPAVRLEVKSRVPGVHVVPLPADPSAYCDTLQRLWLFDGMQATAVDDARTRMAHDEHRRKEDLQAAVSLDAFLSQLELRVDVGVAASQDWPRVAQLTQRTNQFNLSLKRRSLEEVAAVAATMPLLIVDAGDRFGSYGVVGACILGPGREPSIWEIDTLLMSCRALGRGVEDAFLHGIATFAVERGAVYLRAQYVEGPRNSQVKAFLARSGFQEEQPNDWMRALLDVPALPSHVRFSKRENGAVRELVP